MFLACPNCNAGVEGEIQSEYESKNFDDWTEAQRYIFLKCPRCEKPILLQQEREVDYSGVFWANLGILYPKVDFHINPVIPNELRESLVESIQCYKAKSHTATAIMCRRTIEGFCVAKGIKEKNLALSIKRLKSEGIINEQLFDWANELRLLGNEAAHSIEVTFTDQDAKDILDFTIAILDFTYSFKDKFEKFKQRLQVNRGQKVS